MKSSFHKLTNRYAALMLLLSALVFSGCIKDVINPDKTGSFVKYTIPKGGQSSTPSSYKFYTNIPSLSFDVRFDSTAIYQTTNPSNQADINKLYGFADDNKAHWVSSARIGWRWFGNELQLLGYVYNDSVNVHQLITAVPLNKDIACSIQVNGSKYTLMANGKSIELPRTAKSTGGLGYRLYPFFGGDEMAPHEMYIQVREN
jgi:hypothetical protein